MKALKILFILAIVIIAAMFFLNPAEDAHKEAISNHYKEQMKKDNAKAVFAGIADAIAGALGDQEYHNHYLYSTVKSKIKEETVSIGVFGLVFVTHDFVK